MKMTDTDWIEVQNSSLFDTFVEISSSLDESIESRPPVVILRNSDSSYVKLAEEDLSFGDTADNCTTLINSGSWELNEPKAGKTRIICYLPVFHNSY